MITSILVLAFSFFIVAFSIKPIITIAIQKRLFDAPTEARKIHKRIIPNLGGLAIFTGFLLSTALFVKDSEILNANYILAAGVVIFITGLKDDIIGVDPMKKFIAQFAAAFIITILGDLRIMDLGGLLGVHQLAYPFSIGLSVFLFVGVINAYNLVDGIDGLAGFLAVMISLVYAGLFYMGGETQWTYLCLALAGSVGGFLVHNVSPARIFMGDCGSLMIGFMVSVLTIHFLNMSAGNPVLFDGFAVSSAPALALAIVALPVFDTLRVFTIRILNQQSPFKADRNHMHHRMLDLGLTHMQATGVLVLVSLLFVGTALALQPIGNNQLVATLLLIVLTLNTGLSIYLYSKRLSQQHPAATQPAARGRIKAAVPNPSSAAETKKFAESVLREVAKHS
ncbi:MraY family glycosyltransferase [Arcticibacter sp. MXS-1]|uniref:MraY family glycosyltransferase n=1 Tax=Arcticibacter sp. MXS-1 TaxID=3341726 RepID=UPI0035A994F2